MRLKLEVLILRMGECFGGKMRLAAISASLSAAVRL
jgi:hypothetical protein